MKKDISSIISNDGGKVEIHGKSVFEPVTFCGNNFIFPEGAEIDGEIANMAGRLTLRATVSGKVTAACARCGKPVTKGFSFEMEENLVKENSESTDEDAVCFSGSVINVDDIALNAFLINAPTKYLCSEDCKGLCPVCGKNLNEGECGCERNNQDPRFDILNNLEF
ncbi:MAG: DUF177 domain-containing protein [Bacillota bacterium]|nr:DUF177 domain-containing protein [Bacillota bacterium]